ncbi:lasso peptide biosynthesis PqqD family chaperone [Acaryochloris sp. IP29b_bin.137]|uniref:lasso peptide biosynthesis PqqD family chaperone n=1 Tax=Acaryochloris sp. IP29b_bin.137 TaxID=2969217 RepID=UPI0026098837|nr:lasso peptide biosynthesis PqqD family chaperone [Acaryochloris sp. IP29b_bin.137]
MATTLSIDTTVVATPEQVSSDLAGESVILNLKTGMYFGLNEVGASIWNLLQQPRSVQEICNQILDQYDVESDQCEQDVLRLLNELVESELIEIKDVASA